MYNTPDIALLIREHVVLLIMADTIDVDIKKALAANMVSSRIYAQKLRMLKSDALQALFDNRKSMRTAGVKILDMKREKDRVYVQYLIRGYTHDFTLLGGKIKTEILLKIAEGLGVDIAEI